MAVAADGGPWKASGLVSRNDKPLRPKWKTYAYQLTMVPVEGTWPPIEAALGVLEDSRGPGQDSLVGERSAADFAYRVVRPLVLPDAVHSTAQRHDSATHGDAEDRRTGQPLLPEAPNRLQVGPNRLDLGRRELRLSGPRRSRHQVFEWRKLRVSVVDVEP